MRTYPEDPVRADELESMTRDRVQGYVGGVVEHHRHVELRAAHQVECRHHGIATALARDVGKGAAHCRLVRRAGVGDLDPLAAEGAEDVLPFGQPVCDVFDYSPAFV